jgi:hypothetical protein
MTQPVKARLPRVGGCLPNDRQTLMVNIPVPRIIIHKSPFHFLFIICSTRTTSHASQLNKAKVSPLPIVLCNSYKTMSPDEETPISPPTSPPRTIASIVEQFAPLKTKIGEDSTPAMQHGLDECEVPTAPPSPNLTPMLPDRAELEPAKPGVESESGDSWKDSYVLIKANEEKCALCFLDCSGFTPFHRVSHMNECWDTLLEQVAEDKKRQSTLAELRRKPERLIEQHNEKKSGSTLASSKSHDSNPFESTKVTSPSKAEAPGPSSSENAASPRALTEAVAPSRITKPWSSLCSKNIPITSCLLCEKELRSFDTLTAFSHRVNCLIHRCPRFCPICTADFQYPSDWEKPEVAWHLHNCHHGGGLSIIDKDDFVALTAVWAGCMEIIERVLLGGTKTKPGDRVRIYTEKRDEGIKGGGGMYRSPPSMLRSAKTHKGDKLEIVKVRQAFIPRSLGIGQFRRKMFDVLSVRKHFKISEGFKIEHVEIEVLAEEVEAIAAPASDDSRTPSWNVQAAIDSLFRKGDEAEEPTIPGSSVSVAGEIQRSSPALTVGWPLTIESAAVELANAAATPLPENDSSIDLAQNDAAHDGEETEAESDTKTPTLRPPPGLQSPVYLTEDFDRLLTLMHGSTISTDAMDAEVGIEDGTGVEDDAETDDGSCSTVSDHEHDEKFLARESVATWPSSGHTSMLTEVLKGFPSAGLDDWPIVRLPPAPRPKMAVRKRVFEGDPYAPVTTTAMDYFEAHDNRGDIIVVEIAPVSFAIEHRARLARQLMDANKTSVVKHKANRQDEDADSEDAYADWVASKARAQAFLNGTLLPGAPLSTPASSLPLSSLLSPPLSLKHHDATHSPLEDPFQPPRLSPIDPPAVYNSALTPSVFRNPDLTDDHDHHVETVTYYYPPRGYLRKYLQSNVITDVTENMTWEVVTWRNRGLCVFGEVDELRGEEE